VPSRQRLRLDLFRRGPRPRAHRARRAGRRRRRGSRGGRPGRRPNPSRRRHHRPSPHAARTGRGLHRSRAPPSQLIGGPRAPAGVAASRCPSGSPRCRRADAAAAHPVEVDRRVGHVPPDGALSMRRTARWPQRRGISGRTAYSPVLRGLLGGSTPFPVCSDVPDRRASLAASCWSARNRRPVHSSHALPPAAPFSRQPPRAGRPPRARVPRHHSNPITTSDCRQQPVWRSVMLHL
jgi:hypothetical protein